MKRIKVHPVLSVKKQEEVEITVNQHRLTAYKGEMIAATLIANGIDVFRRTSKYHEPRSIFCGIGQCNDCAMTVNGVPNVRTCITPVEAGMIIQTQEGSGRLGEKDDA